MINKNLISAYFLLVFVLLVAGCSSYYRRYDDYYKHVPLSGNKIPNSIEIRTSGEVSTITVGTTLELTAIGWYYYSGDYYFKPVNSIWRVISGVGSVTADGKFYSDQAGSSEIIASYEGRTATKVILVNNLTSEVIFFDGAEDSLSNWVVNGFTISEMRCHNGSRSFYSGRGNNLNNTLELKTPIHILGTERLRFWIYYSSGLYHDKLFVETSENGTNWSSISSYHGLHTYWSEENISLSSYAGKTIYIRFRYTTNSSYSYEGFYLDDIIIER